MRGKRDRRCRAAPPGPLQMFKLKGRFPNFAWYDPSGYGAQQSRFVACTPAASIGAESFLSVSGTGIWKWFGLARSTGTCCAHPARAGAAPGPR
jgi:hypothetical protein